ncbi:hypothetical protein FIBSPDRAFT_963994 [Athelia psychrophila]|uniref:DUF6534 domain-containing protein n=1 Tax=Athelia psychrophila TaxID=1759441 RepID=A0A165YAZ8_9AGAM|nr:hypothetical protein FIBSPDRAFT_963994 [Fibularhizoctonia sp. CBS 109695]
MVELFFAWRLHILGNQRWLTLFIVACALLTFLGGIGTGIAVYWIGDFALFETIRPIAMIWLISAVVADITITVNLTYHLRRHRASFKATERLLDHITQVTIQNGLFTMLVTLADLILYLATPKPYHLVESNY